MGRIYLPAEDLASFKIALRTFRQAAIPERLRWLLAAEADRAREYYGAAETHAADRRRQPARALGSGDHLPPLLEKIADRKYDVFSKKSASRSARKSSSWERVW